ncbi:hypothetical protein HZC35_02405 [Candidatus Saganbacteria bacterium]|nr:hypothetical protein [Candidatus Saganbacteria bacterium]
MKKAAALIAIFLFLTGIITPALGYDYAVKKLYDSPDAASKIVYEIPIDVKMLDVSEDANWYKVKIQFNLGLMTFKYSGWAYIPVGDLLAERAQKEIAVTDEK